MTTGRLNNFDLIRLLAALLVIFFHAVQWLNLKVDPQLLSFLYMFNPIPIFFTISGFLVVKSYVDNKGNLKRYLLNRIFRIYPALWVNLLVIMFMLFATHALSPNDILTYPFLSRQIIFFSIGNKCPTFLCGSDPFHWNGFYKLFPSGVLWTVTIELGFYTLIPLIFWFYVKSRFKYFYLIIILCVFLSFSFSFLNTYFIKSHSASFLSWLIHDTIPAYLWIFLIGAFAYLKWNVVSIYFIDKFIYWIIFYILFSLLCLKINHTPILDYKIISFSNILRVFILSGCVISFAYSFKFLNFLTGKMDLSFGLYLYHMQIIFTLLFLGFSHLNYLWLIVYGGTLLLALFSWFLIEKPFLQLKTLRKKIDVTKFTIGFSNDQL
jgi:peptidoglycan/LPS O-acetylase OafA/YrhL